MEYMVNVQRRYLDLKSFYAIDSAYMRQRLEDGTFGKPKVMRICSTCPYTKRQSMVTRKNARELNSRSGCRCFCPMGALAAGRVPMSMLNPTLLEILYGIQNL